VLPLVWADRFFDVSSDGKIERKELAFALQSGTRVWGRKTSPTLADHLFQQARPGTENKNYRAENRNDRGEGITK
jgi:hypothetical protein